MVNVKTFERRHRDGSLSYTVRCGLEEILDMEENVLDNPIQVLKWNPTAQQYELENTINSDDTTFAIDTTGGLPSNTFRNNNSDDDSDDDDLDDNVTIGNTTFVDLSPTQGVSSSSSTDDPPQDTILARECWCARIFQQYNDEANGGSPNIFREDNQFLEGSAKPLFCPIDTNADGRTNSRDVRVCTTSALYNQTTNRYQTLESYCFTEEPWSEFSKSAWPLCFFWGIILIYVLLVTSYGQRVRGYAWRAMCLGLYRCKAALLCCAGRKSRRRRRRRRQRAQRDLEQNDNPQNNGDENDDDTDSISTHSTSSASVSSTILDTFGSHENYRLLDRELRHQAATSRNEFVTWLWYSAVYTEVRNYRYTRWRNHRRRARERERRRRRREWAGARNFDDNEANDNEDDDSEDDMFGSRNLDSVFWWPPSGPDGQRWRHLRFTSHPGLRARILDEDGNLLDATQMVLKTKVFTLNDENHNKDTSDETNSEDHATMDNTDDNTEETGIAMVSLDDGCKTTKNIADTSSMLFHNDFHNDEENNDNIPENTCSICLSELQEGDIVGDIPCGHVFHKDCLKEWLHKNNHCPICRAPNIASYPILTPARRETTETAAAETGAASNNVDGSSSNDDVYVAHPSVGNIPFTVLREVTNANESSQTSVTQDVSA